MNPTQTPQEILKEGEQKLHKGHIGAAKKCVLRTFILLSEAGTDPEAHAPFMDLVSLIRIAETLQETLISHPAESQNFLSGCTEKLRQISLKTRRTTLENLHSQEKNKFHSV